MSFRLLALAFGVLLATNAAAQLATQTAIVGTVTDSSGSVVPGAAVTAVNVGTQDRYEAVTNEQGQYNMQFVRMGKYEITVTLAGFQTFKATGVDVGNNQVVRRDAVLQRRRPQRNGGGRGRGDRARHGQRDRIRNAQPAPRR